MRHTETKILIQFIYLHIEGTCVQFLYLISSLFVLIKSASLVSQIYFFISPNIALQINILMRLGILFKQTNLNDTLLVICTDSNLNFIKC